CKSHISLGVTGGHLWPADTYRCQNGTFRLPEGSIRRSTCTNYFGQGRRMLLPCCICPQVLRVNCRRNMRSSSLGNLESSALLAGMAKGGSKRGAVDVSKGGGRTEGLERS